jgi:hypothetical protein
MSQQKEPLGFVSFAINSDATNYLELAYLQALNVKATQTNCQYAVIVDKKTNDQIRSDQQEVFDHVIVLQKEYDNPFEAESRVFSLTPFRETIKLESDLLFTRSIDHWWTAFRLRDVCLSTGAKNIMGTYSAVRKYRQLFDANRLPDVYNGLMYFRYTQTAMEFFNFATDLFQEWDIIKMHLEAVELNLAPTTDVVYALAALIMGEDAVTIPSLDFLNFVHMKSGFNGWSDTRSWLDTVVTERADDIIRINNLNQYSPVHYHDKSYATKELIKYYEDRYYESRRT